MAFATAAGARGREYAPRGLTSGGGRRSVGMMLWAEERMEKRIKTMKIIPIPLTLLKSTP